MQKRMRRGIGGIVCATVAIVAVLGASVARPVSAEETTRTGNRVFFRGGFAALNSDRGGELFTDGHNAIGVGTNNDSSGYYIGAGTDLMLTRDTWGLAERVGILGEIGVEYKRWSSKTVANSHTTGVTGVSNGGLSKVQVTMLTVDVALKIKFRQGTDL